MIDWFRTREVKRLRYELSLSLRRARAAEEAYSSMREERDKWRAQYELVLHTPEYKLDAEKAFSRGEASQKAKFAAWLTTVGQQIMAGQDYE